MIDFVVERYNYWIAIVLMMIGLYIVISRGNLVKKIVGLNIFQTSVFIYYISIGKIFGGTAPIIIGGHGEEHAAPEHPAQPPAEGSALHAAPSAEVADLPANSLDSARPGDAPPGDALHAAPDANTALLSRAPAPSAPAFDIVPDHDAASAGADALHRAADVIYSNPLPHVLILTAIVVGVATTAVGLALAVRIREAYGTVEEDELEAADDIAEFGEDYAKMQEASA